MSDEHSAENLLALRSTVETQRKLIAAIKADGSAFYRPHEKQDLFHRAGECRHRAVFAGNRFGKSHLGCAEDIAWLRNERVWYAKDEPARTAGIPQHPTKGLVITTDWDKVDEIWTSERGDKPGKVWRYMPSGFLKTKKRNHSGAIDTIECMNGSLLRFDTVKSFMANPQGSESSDWDFIHVDEPCPEDMFNAVARGLMDRNGKDWFTLTALSEPWIVDRFHEAGFNSNVREAYWVCLGSTYDNPYLSKEAIAEYEATLNEDERQCRIHGIPLHLAGIVYKAFKPQTHVLHEPPIGWPAIDVPPDDATIYVRIDPHPQTPHAMLFCAVNQLDQRFYFTDVFMHGTVPELVAELRRIVGGRQLGSVKIDPIAYIEDQNNPGTTMASQFWRLGVPVQKARKDLASGIIKVNDELARKPQAVWFCSTARRTLWEIQRYMWDPKGTNKPVDKDDHMMENLYRMELDEPRHVDGRNYNLPVEDIVIDRTDTSPIVIGAFA
jgi:hypothetical protein